MSLETAAPPAGWYPDPAELSRLRWWDGASWTDHVHPEPEAVPVLPRVSRDPALRAVEQEYAATPRRDPYRDRNVLGGLALVVAVLSIPATALSLLFPLPVLADALIGGTPFGVAVVGLIASLKLQFPTRMAWLAIGIAVATMVVGWVAGAAGIGEVPLPTVTDVPGVGDIIRLQDEAGLGG